VEAEELVPYSISVEAGRLSERLAVYAEVAAKGIVHLLEVYSKASYLHA
jgi:hypothetical protein